jgi:hypothetical protein
MMGYGQRFPILIHKNKTPDFIEGISTMVGTVGFERKKAKTQNVT